VPGQIDISWHDVATWLGTHGVVIAIVLVVAVIVSWLSGIAVRRAYQRLEAASSATETLSMQRLTTLTHATTNAVRVLIWVTALVVILVSFNIDLGPFLTSAGLVAFAVAFGTQHYIHDVVGGFFVLVENQYDVGDLVTLRVEGQDVDGWVRSVTFRRTELERDEGRVSYVPHGKVSMADNRSRGRGRVRVDVSVPEGADLDRVRAELEELSGEIRRDQRVSQTVFTGPEVAHQESDGRDVMTISVETRPERRDEIEQKLRREIDRRIRPIANGVDVQASREAA
jgi:moderate conductance mechanosensitive channel